jgi:hypothetical protein
VRSLCQTAPRRKVQNSLGYAALLTALLIGSVFAGHRLKAADRTIQVRPVTRQDQGEEPEQPGDDPGAGGGVAIGGAGPYSGRRASRLIVGVLCNSGLAAERFKCFWRADATVSAARPGTFSHQ